MSPKQKDEIDSMLSDILIKTKVDKKGKVKYEDMHEAIMQVRIKIQNYEKDI